MKRVLLILCCALPLVADAEDHAPSVYESLDDVVIGRVFLSAEERQRLDATRGIDPAGTPAASSTPVAAAPAAASAPAEGYIRAAGKAPRVFRDGNFVKASGKEPVRFRTEGTIRRHVHTEGETEPEG